MQGCLSSCDVCVIVTSKVGACFKFSKGHRQGNSSSPTLVTLVLDMFARMVDRIKNYGITGCLLNLDG